MKTERRHELHSNELAQFLSNYQSHVKPFVRWVLGIVLAVAVAWIGLSWMKVARTRQIEASWTEFVRASKARDVDGLRQVAQRFPRTPAAARALYSAAMISVQQGCGELLIDRASALETLGQAKRDFEAAMASANQDRYVVAQALLGLAQAYEGMNKLDDAKLQYERIISDHRGTAYADIARQRMEFLNRADTVAFSDWFAQQKMEMPPVLGTSNQRPQGPSIHDDLPISRDFLLPDADALQRSVPDGDFGTMLPPDQGTDSTAPSIPSGPSFPESAGEDASADSKGEPAEPLPAGDENQDEDDPPSSE